MKSKLSQGFSVITMQIADASPKDSLYGSSYGWSLQPTLKFAEKKCTAVKHVKAFQMTIIKIEIRSLTKLSLIFHRLIQISSSTRGNFRTFFNANCDANCYEWEERRGKLIAWQVRGLRGKLNLDWNLEELSARVEWRTLIFNSIKWPESLSFSNFPPSNHHRNFHLRKVPDCLIYLFSKPLYLNSSLSVNPMRNLPFRFQHFVPESNCVLLVSTTTTRISVTSMGNWF